MAVRMFNYRLYPSQVQIHRLIESFKTSKVIYNELLALSNDTYKFGGVRLNKFDLDSLTKGRNDILFSQSRQNISDRLHKAFQNFFRRLKDPSCKKKGFPRYKSRINSITYPQAGFKLLSDKRLRASKIGDIPIVLHRIPKGKIKILTIKQDKARRWFAIFACEIDELAVKHVSTESVGMDVGLETLATLSDGSKVENPRWLLKSERRLKKLHRELSRKVKGSSNRRKARFRLARGYAKIADQRSDFLHKASKSLALKYSTITVEGLNIKNMVTNHCLAKHIHDASWNNFIRMLSYKAVTCGGQVISVNPRGTSRTCSSCGTKVEMPLSKRQFDCPGCGVSLHRDLNAAINIKRRAGLARTYTPVDIKPLPSHVGKASSVVEAGTICVG